MLAAAISGAIGELAVCSFGRGASAVFAAACASVGVVSVTGPTCVSSPVPVTFTLWFAWSSIDTERPQRGDRDWLGGLWHLECRAKVAAHLNHGHH